jgi:Ni,Fe-hydrogenase maturation factor
MCYVREVLAMDTKDIQFMITKELASKVVSALPDEQKNMIIADAVRDILARETMSSDYKISVMLRDYALDYAREYAQTPEIQEELRKQAHKAVDDVLQGILKNIGRAIENDIKNNYTRILSEKHYGE